MHYIPAQFLCSRTHKVPLSIGHVPRHICLPHLDVQQPAIKSPWAELQLTALDVKWKPSHIHITRADKYPLKFRDKKENVFTAQ